MIIIIRVECIQIYMYLLNNNSLTLNWNCAHSEHNHGEMFSRKYSKSEI